MDAKLLPTVAIIDRVLVSRDGLRALLLTRPEGPAPVSDAMAVAFTAVLSSKDRGPRTVVRISNTVFELYRPESLGVPTSGDKTLDWYLLGEATLGDWIDGLEPGTNLAALASPMVIPCTTHTLDSWKNRARADDDDILSYAANKLYWAWRFELESGARFTAADCLRLGTSLSTFKRMLLLEDPTSWNQRESNEHTVRYVPTSAFLRVQREQRMLSHASSAKATLDAGLAAPRYSVVRAHLSKAQAFLTQDPPDLANSAKESISAVEELARLVCDDPTSTLGDLIKVLKNKQGLDPALVKALEGMWGYTSNAPGVRHSGAADLDVAQAQMTLDLARSTIHYLLRADTS